MFYYEDHPFENYPDFESVVRKTSIYARYQNTNSNDNFIGINHPGRLTSIRFKDYNDPSGSGGGMIPHSVVKFKLLFDPDCNNPDYGIDYTIDNTRARMKYYPFVNENDLAGPNTQEHDIAIVLFNNSTDDWFYNGGGNDPLNYFPPLFF